MFSVLFVCTGNICRSPTAHALLRDMVRARGLDDIVKIASAGTTAYHVGERADERTVATAHARGVLMDDLRARQFCSADWQSDLILVASVEHLQVLQRRMPAEWSGKLALILPGADVPDPYYGGQSGFEDVFDILYHACQQWLNYIEQQLDRLQRN